MWKMRVAQLPKKCFWPGDIATLRLEQLKEKSYTVSSRQSGWKEDVSYFVSDIGEYLDLVFVGTESIKNDKYLTFFAEPIFPVGFYGARGIVNAPEILNKLAGMFSIPGVISSRSIVVKDYENLISSKTFATKIIKGEYVYGKNDFSPQSFINGKYEKEGKIERNLSFFSIILGFNEDGKNIFSPEIHWLANTFTQTYPDHAEFGVGCVQYNTICFNDNCQTLFSTNGREGGEIMCIRPVISINAKYSDFYLNGYGLTSAMETLANIKGIYI